MHEDDQIEAENDFFDGDSAYAGSSSASLTETLSSHIARGVSEHGRTYAAYGNEEYGLPIDEEELDRIDMSHAKYLMLMDKKLFLAPIGDNPQQILDLGTGTGIWAINVADTYPSAEVLGIDLAPVQPQWLPPNCRMEIDDCEQPWTYGYDKFDFIHARDLLLSIRDWPKLVKQSFEHIKPGGWLELQCIFPDIQCDDGTSPEDSGTRRFAKHALDAAKVIGCPLDACTRYKEYMEAAGFVDVTEVVVKVPSGPWAKDKRMKLIGAFEMHNLLRGLSGMSLRMFSRAYGWSVAETELLLASVRKDLQNMSYHTYYNFYLVYGRKPTSSSRSTPALENEPTPNVETQQSTQ